MKDRLDTAPELVAALNDKYADCLTKTESAVREKTEQYLVFRRQVGEILSRTIDVSEYYTVSCALAEAILAIGQQTIFYHYFYESIHPNINGRARYFRSICRDLKNRIEEFDVWRSRRRNIRLIQTSKTYR
jgi:hypothetical protein